MPSPVPPWDLFYDLLYFISVFPFKVELSSCCVLLTHQLWRKACPISVLCVQPHWLPPTWDPKPGQEGMSLWHIKDMGAGLGQHLSPFPCNLPLGSANSSTGYLMWDKCGWRVRLLCAVLNTEQQVKPYSSRTVQEHFYQFQQEPCRQTACRDRLGEFQEASK